MTVFQALKPLTCPIDHKMWQRQEICHFIGWRRIKLPFICVCLNTFDNFCIGYKRTVWRKGWHSHRKTRWNEIFGICWFDDDLGSLFTLLVVLPNPLVYPTTSLHLCMEGPPAALRLVHSRKHLQQPRNSELSNRLGRSNIPPQLDRKARPHVCPQMEAWTSLICLLHRLLFNITLVPGHSR